MSVYVPPATNTNGVGCSGGCGTTDSLKYNYLKSYFNAHMLSVPSHRYLYVMWFILIAFISFLSILHHSNISTSTSVGAWWTKFSTKNRVIKTGNKNRIPNGNGKKRKVITFPSVARMLLLLAFFLLPVALTLIGADYIKPTDSMFNVTSSFPPQYPNGRLPINSKRSFIPTFLNQVPSSHSEPQTFNHDSNSSSSHFEKRLLWGIGPYPSVTTIPSTITLPYRTWWTAGGRTGCFTNALTPFIVILALKQIPFAFLSLKLFGGYAFDRLSFLHKWGGRIVWLFAAFHVATWSVQLYKDTAFQTNIWGFVFMWQKFRWGFVSFGFLTLLVALSIGPIRRDYYEIFYISHVILVLGFMLSAWAHHPPLGGWMWATLLYWAAERITRAIKIAYVNGLGFAGRRPKVVIETDAFEKRRMIESYRRQGGNGINQASFNNQDDFNPTNQQRRMPPNAINQHSNHRVSSSYSNSSTSKGGYPRSGSTSTNQTLHDPSYDWNHKGSVGANELGYNYPPANPNRVDNEVTWSKGSSSSYSQGAGSSNRDTYGSTYAHGNGMDPLTSSPPPPFNASVASQMSVSAAGSPPPLESSQRPEASHLSPNGAATGAHRVNTQFYEPLDDVLEGYIRDRKSGIPSSPSPGPGEDENITPTATNPLPFSANTSHPLQHPPPQKFALEDVGHQSQPYPLSPNLADQAHSSADDYRTGIIRRPNPSSRPSTADSSLGTLTGLIPKRVPRPAMPADVAAVIRPGFAFVQLLPGKTLRLTLRTPNRMSWQPGQWVNLNLPSVRWWESHPFTIASAHDAEFPSSTRFEDEDEEREDLESGEKRSKVRGEERTIVLLLRARKGFTAHLWEYTRKQRSLQLQAAHQAGYDKATLLEGIAGPNSNAMGTKSVAGVHLRAIVDGPYGSSTRVKWGSQSTIMIVCGGSGVSFGMSLLEHLCACIAGKEAFGRSGKGGRKFETKRIRFVWMLREFSHLQWVASALRRCIEMVPPEQLQVDLFVTHYNNTQVNAPQPQKTPNNNLGFINMDDGLSVPKAPFATGPDGYISPNTFGASSSPSGFSTPSGRTQQPRIVDGSEQEEYDVTAYDLTHFEGEDQSAPTDAEQAINTRIRNEGKLRRAHTRKVTMKRKNRGGNDGKTQRELMRDEQALESQRAVYEGTSSTGMINHFRPQPNPYPPHPHSKAQSQLQPAASNHPQNIERDIGDESPGYFYGNSQRPQDDSIPRSNLLNRQGPNGDGYFQASLIPRSGETTPSSRPSSPGNTFSSLPDTPLPQSTNQSTTRLVGTPLNVSNDSDYEYSSMEKSNRMPSSRSPTNQSNPQRNPSNFNLGQTDKEEEDLGSKAPIDLDEQEDLDLRVVAELARPGHPKLDRILRDEVEKSQGKILVASCGPGSLATVLKSVVSKQIDPNRVRKGDMRGMINIVTESYEWGG